jgi:TetR/AcrR family transcriptional regulator, cholesterol catabolism regulator
LLKNGSELLSGINPRYFADLQRLYPGIWNEKVRQSKIHSHQLIRDLIKKGINDGIYRKDINEEIISLILIEQLYMLSDKKILHAGKFSIVEMYENIIITMTRGLATPKGLKLLENYQHQAPHQ